MLPRNIYIAYDESISGGEICAGQENDIWPSYEEQVVDLSLLYASLTPPSDPHFDIETIEPDANFEYAKCVYVVLVRYYDGDTFGSTTGLHKIMGVYADNKDAECIRDAIKGKYYDSKQNRGSGYDGNPWTGYFAGLESVDVVRLTLQ